MSTSDDDVVVLYQLPRGRWVPNLSPPCMKVEMVLRLGKVPYRAVDASRMSPPEGRWPWIVHKKKVICDSRRIVQYLIATFNLTMNDGLTESQIATGVMLRRLCEDHLYYCATRHALVEKWKVAIKYSTVPLPDLLVNWFYEYMRGAEITKLNHGNVGDLTDAEYHADYLDDVKVIAALLPAAKTRKSGGAFILGTPEPTTYDCVVFSHIIALRQVEKMPEMRCPANDYLASDARLRSYVETMERLVYPDLDDLVADAQKVPMHRTDPLVTLKQAKWLAIGAAVAALGYIARLCGFITL